MKHNVIYRYLLLFMLSLSISGIMFFGFSHSVHAAGTTFTIDFEKASSDYSSYSYLRFPISSSPVYNFSGGIDSDSYYKLSFDIAFDYEYEYRLYYFNPNVYMVAGDTQYLVSNPDVVYDYSDLSYITTEHFTCYIKGSELSNVRFVFDICAVMRSDHTVSLSVDTEFGNVSIVPLDIDSFDQASYDQGYAAGLSQGHQDGYQSGYYQGYIVGEADGYDKGYDAGVSSGADYNDGFEDGHSIGYQVGYNAGYDVGLSDGYAEGFSSGYNSGFSDGHEAGYIEGFNAAKSSAGSGADKVGTSPKLDIYYFDNKLGDGVAGPVVETHFISDLYQDLTLKYYGHTTLSPFYYISGFEYFSDTVLQGEVDCCLDLYIDKIFFSDISDNSTLYSFPDLFNIDVYSSDGDRLGYDVDYVVENTTDQFIATINLKIHLGDNFRGGNIMIRPYLNITAIGDYLEPVWVEYCGAVISSTVKYYVAPKDFDDIVDGYNNNSGNSMNDDFSSGLNDFHDQENSLFTSVKTGIDDFSFYDFESAPAMLTGISFVSSIMTGWFDAAGGVSGVGIILSILFSIIIASMALGLYKWYQSRGK